MPSADPAAIRAPEVRDATILLVDDEEANVQLLTRILRRAGFTRVHGTTTSADVLPLFAELSPDLIVLDVRMPPPDGFEVLAQLAAVIAPTDYLPVLAVTGDASPDTRQRVLVAGARDFLQKPYESAEVVVRIENLLTTRRLHRSLQRQNLSLEEKVRERTAELQAALAAAEAGSRSKGQFLATISHELRTPLNAIIGFANHLRKNKPGNLLPQDLDLLQRIGENGTHLLHMITDILDLSRVEAGKMAVDRSEVSLDQLIIRALGQLDGAASVETRLALPGTLRPIVTDEDKLRRILLNLAGNAAKFTEKGFLCVSVCADADGKPLRIDVVDTGIGIPADRLDAIFDMFEQADNSTRRRFGGTGLGLAISRTLCELLGYRLTVVSAMGVGSAFSVLLDPAAPAPVSYDELASACAKSSPMCA